MDTVQIHVTAHDEMTAWQHNGYRAMVEWPEEGSSSLSVCEVIIMIANYHLCRSGARTHRDHPIYEMVRRPLRAEPIRPSRFNRQGKGH